MADAFDLNAFAPPPVSFTFREQTWMVYGEPLTDQVARMLRIETAITEADGIEETLAVVEEGCKILTDLVHDYDASQPEVQMGAQALLVTFALILHGSSVAAAVAEAISQPPQTDPATGEPVQTADDGRDEETRDGDVAPLASDTLSSERSSSSDERESGLLVTGTA